MEGTQRFHKFVPQNQSQLKVFETSSDITGYIKCITKESSSTRNIEVNIGNYVVCVYDDKIWIGLVNEYEEEFDDFLISFLYPQGFQSSINSLLFQTDAMFLKKKSWVFLKHQIW